MSGHTYIHTHIHTHTHTYIHTHTTTTITLAAHAHRGLMMKRLNKMHILICTNTYTVHVLTNTH